MARPSENLFSDGLNEFCKGLGLNVLNSSNFSVGKI